MTDIYFTFVILSKVEVEMKICTYLIKEMYLKIIELYIWIYFTVYLTPYLKVAFKFKI